MTIPSARITRRPRITWGMAALFAALAWGAACSDRIQPTAPGRPSLDVQSGDTLTLSGTLFDRDGVPIPDSVQVCAVPAVSCTAGGNGAYSLRTLPGTDTLQLTQVADSFATRAVPGSFSLWGATVTLTSDSVMNFTLPNVLLTVVVLGPDSQPVPNMLIEATGAPVFPLFPGGWVYGWQKTTRYSDSTGVARLPLFADTALTLTVIPSVQSGLERVELDGLVMDTDQTIPIVLAPAGPPPPPPTPVTFSGILRDRDDNPIPDSINVLLFGTASYSTVSAGDGSFSLTVPSGNYALSLGRWAWGAWGPHAVPNYFYLSGPTIAIAADRVQDFRLETAFLQVTVLGPDGQPLNNAYVAAEGQPTLEPFPGAWFSGYQWAWSGTDAAGVGRLALFRGTLLSVRVQAPVGSGLRDTTLWNLPLSGDAGITVSLGGEIPVTIDVKPGDAANVINLQSALVPVAVLSTWVFDATSSDDGTVTFAGAHPNEHRGLLDVNGDGLLDVVFHFPTGALSLRPGATHACLAGRTMSGTLFLGCDAVRIVVP